MKKLIIICGASGSGKDTIANIFKENGYSDIVTYTTRPIRKGEKNGVDHYYISEEEYDRMKKLFQLKTTYRGFRYGTHRDDIKEGSVLIVDNDSAFETKEMFGDRALFIYVQVSEEVRLDRLCKRGDNPSDIAKALCEDMAQFKYTAKYADLVINNEYSSIDELRKEINKVISKLR